MKSLELLSVAVLMVTLPAMAPAADDASALRAELQALRSEYLARVDALETRIKQLETASDAQAALAVSPPPVPYAPPAPVAGGGASASAFNPAISVVLGGSYTNAARDPGSWTMAGFPSSGDEIGPGDRNFNLGESELTLAASIDPYFSGQATFAVTGDNEIEVEEAFVRTSSLPDGVTAKLGRFFSGAGYLNEVHAHAWDFVDQPLVYQALFGGQLSQDGVQVKWLAPADLFLEFGAEAGSGDSFPGTRRNHNGLNGETLFAHVGGDVGDYASWRAGAAWLEHRSEDRGGDLEDVSADTVLSGFTGTSRTWIADAVYKWAPSPRRQIKVQGEYFRRSESGEFVAGAPLPVDVPVRYRNAQSGWYVQSVYQFAARWRAGLRYDALDSGDARYLPTLASPPIDFLDVAARHPERVSVMLDWNPSEFSRLRAQYDWDDARADGERDRILRLQYLFGIGAHGAHKY